MELRAPASIMEAPVPLAPSGGPEAPGVGGSGGYSGGMPGPGQRVPSGTFIPQEPAGPGKNYSSGGSMRGRDRMKMNRLENLRYGNWETDGRPQPPAMHYQAAPGQGGREFHYTAQQAPTPVAGFSRADQIIREARLRAVQRHFEQALGETMDLEKALLDAPAERRERMEAKFKALQGFTSRLESQIHSLTGGPTPFNQLVPATGINRTVEPVFEH